MVSFAGSLFAAAFMFFFVYLFVSAYNFGVKSRTLGTLPGFWSTLTFWAFVFMGAWLCYCLLSLNRTLFYWDYGRDWIQTVISTDITFSRPLMAILRLGGRVWFTDYNNIAPTIIALPSKIAGYSFTRYVLINYACFLVPAWFVLLSAIRSQTGTKSYTFLFMFVAFTMTPLYTPILESYIDASSLVPASLSMLLLKDYDPLSLSREQIKRDVYISGLLLCTLMFRRYFAFYVEGYVFALAMLSLYSVIAYRGSESRFRLLKNAFTNIVVIGLFALAVMVIFFAPMLIRVLRNNYAGMYEAFDNPLKEKVLGVISTFGGFSFILGGLGLILSLVTKTMRRYALFCALSLVFTAGAFFHVQGMGVQHVYILCVQMLLLSAIGVIQICRVLKNKFVRRIALTLCVLVLSIGFARCYFPEVRPVTEPAWRLFARVYSPRIRNDIPELNALADYLNAKTKETDQKVYIMASGHSLNYNLLNNLKLPNEQNHIHNMLTHEAVDLRDGFPVEFLSADLVVTTEPIQLHLKEGTQEVVRFPAQEVMNSDSPIGRHFKRLDRTFTLDNGAKVYIYEKQSEYEPEDIQFMSDYFTKLYPNHRSLFADRIFNHTNYWELQKQRGRSSMVNILKWLLDKEIFTPEDLSDITGKSVQDMRDLMTN